MADTEIDNQENLSFIEEIRNAVPNPEDERKVAAKILAANEEVANKLKKKNQIADICLKYIYGLGILIVLGFWIGFVIKISWKQINPDPNEVHYISDTVFIALLTSATANILALPAIILKYLFPKRHS